MQEKCVNDETWIVVAKRFVSIAVRSAARRVILS